MKGIIREIQRLIDTKKVVKELNKKGACRQYYKKLSMYPVSDIAGVFEIETDICNQIIAISVAQYEEELSSHFLVLKGKGKYKDTRLLMTDDIGATLLVYYGCKHRVEFFKPRSERK